MSTLGLFEGYGIELEYMIADRATLAVAPVADRLLEAASGNLSGDHDDGAIAWSNELVLHVVELKTNGPAPSLSPLPAEFQAAVGRVNALLAPLSARLLPGAMHPTMDPGRETRLWPHDYSVVYQAYDRIFGCSGHGWANLQSCHLNLPFHGDEEFGRLHAAIRFLLPLLPALSAASPVMDGRTTGLLDNRLEVYRKNQARIPAVAGAIVPEPVFTIADYHERILGRIYADAAPHDPEGVLRHEFFNSRGAIARFERSAIEIRVLDVQEAPVADLAIAWLVSSALRALDEGRFVPRERLREFATEPLAALFLRCVKDADRAVVEDRAYLRALGIDAPRAEAGDVWRSLAYGPDRVLPDPPAQGEDEDAGARGALRTVLDRGPLARRLLRRLGAEGPPRALDPAQIRETWGALGDCLAQGRLFDA